MKDGVSCTATKATGKEKTMGAQEDVLRSALAHEDPQRASVH